MTRFSIPLIVFIVSTAQGAEKDGFASLFNGRDLSGWVNVNCAPETWSARDGVIHCNGKPTGALRTARQYENFILELDWRHLTSGGNSGVFIWGTPIAAPGVPFLRGIEVQVLDTGYDVRGKNEWYTTHGDVFPIHGATMKPFGRHNGMRSFPSEQRSKSSPEWNHYRIVCTNGVIRLSVNGKEVSGGEDCNYRKGYLALESEGAPVEFKNVRLQELPSSGVSVELTAPIDLGWRSLFTGVDLRGWRTNSATARWNARNERLVLSDGEASTEGTLWTDADFSKAEFIVDCRLPKEPAKADLNVPVVRLRRGQSDTVEVPLIGAQPGKYVRFAITVNGRNITVATDGKEAQHLTLPSENLRTRLGLSATMGGAEFMNLFVRDL